MGQDKKTINALLKYMRNRKHISINGSKEKKQLMNVGYFHGYKGYRFVCDPNPKLKYNNFGELMAVYEFDMHLKSILYPYIMSIETALKSHAVETCIDLCSDNFVEVYDKLLDKYTKYQADSKEYKDSLKIRLKIRNIVYTSVSERYSRERQEDKNKMITHYQHQGKSVPIWALLEILTLGQFGIFTQTMNDRSSIKLAQNLKLYYSNMDQNGRLIEILIFFLNDLRNAIAHNSVVFDCRFMKSNPPKIIKRFVKEETGIGTEFKSFDDFIALTVGLLLKLEYSKTEVKRFVRSYVESAEKLRSKVPIEIYNKILGTETKSKMSTLLKL